MFKPFSKLIIFLFALLPHIVYAQITAISDNGFLPPTDKPVKVGVGLFINNIVYINDNKSEVDMIVTLRERWTDPRLKFTAATKSKKIYTGGAADAALNRIWVPYLEILRRNDINQNFQTVLTIAADGEVNYIRKLGLNMDADSDIHRFPFDEKIVRVAILPFTYNIDDVQLYPIKEYEGIMPNINVPNWSTSSTYQSKIYNLSLKQVATQRSTYEFSMKFTRNSFHFVIEVLSPLLLISLMCYLMLLTPIRPGDNFQVLITIVLAMIAFQWLVLGVVPSTSYINFSEVIIFISFVFSCAVMIGLSCLEIHEKLHGKERRLKTEKWLRITLLLGYLSAIVLAILAFFLFN